MYMYIASYRPIPFKANSGEQLLRLVIIHLRPKHYQGFLRDSIAESLIVLPVVTLSGIGGHVRVHTSWVLLGELLWEARGAIDHMRVCIGAIGHLWVVWIMTMLMLGLMVMTMVVVIMHGLTCGNLLCRFVFILSFAIFTSKMFCHFDLSFDVNVRQLDALSNCVLVGYLS